MGSVEVDVVSLSSEFPNDNPALHRGVSWVCLETTGRPVAILEARPPEPELVAPPEPAPALVAPPEPAPAPAPVAVEARPEPLVVATVEPFAPILEELLAPEPAAVCAVDLVAPFEIEQEQPVPPARISGIVPAGMSHELEGEDDDQDAILVEELPPLDEHAVVEGAVIVAEAPVVPEPVAPEPVVAVAPVVAVGPGIVDAPRASTALPPAIDDPFTLLLATLADVAVGAGSPHVASVLPGLLLHGRLDHAMPADAAQALAEADVARGSEVTAAFVAQTHAWRAILLGTSDDFAACGNAMLDEWAADLLARLLGAPARATALRRELRSRGVAAFGLVEAA
jgi:hypothetical protein